MDNLTRTVENECWIYCMDDRHQYGILVGLLPGNGPCGSVPAEVLVREKRLVFRGASVRTEIVQKNSSRPMERQASGRRGIVEFSKEGAERGTDSGVRGKIRFGNEIRGSRTFWHGNSGLCLHLDQSWRICACVFHLRDRECPGADPILFDPEVQPAAVDSLEIALGA